MGQGGIIAVAVIIPVITTNPIAIFLTWYFTKKHFTRIPPPITNIQDGNPIYDVPPDELEGIPNPQFSNDNDSDFDSDSYDQVEHGADLSKINGTHSNEDLSKADDMKGTARAVTIQPSVDSTYEKYIPDKSNDAPSTQEVDNRSIIVTINDDDKDDGIYEELADDSKIRKPTLQPKPQRYKDLS